MKFFADPDILNTDHAGYRNGPRRRYACTCGYDEAKDAELRRLRTALLAARTALIACREAMLDQDDIGARRVIATWLRDTVP